MASIPSQGSSPSALARLLLHFCRPIGSADYPMSGVHYDAQDALTRLEEVFPHIRDHLPGAVVIDFGCGLGYQAVAFAQAGARMVLGIEIVDDLLGQARERVKQQGLVGQVYMERKIPADVPLADIIVSQNSFEHFLHADDVLRELAAALAPSGALYITFAPPWYAPTGAHMGFFCRLPWVQLLFPERIVMEARSYFRSDGARTYKEAGLARMSVVRFERLIRAHGLRISFRRYDCIRRLNFFRHIPVLRELTINRVSCILALPATQSVGSR